MAFFKNIRYNKIGNYFLLKHHARAHRDRTIINIESANSIGILYCADRPEDVERVRKYVQTLTDMGKGVKSLGFLNVKAIPPGLNSSAEHHYFSLKELNWYGKPSSTFIRDFINEPFDMLFDFGIPSQLPVIFIASLSKAKCKVGRYLEKYTELYDVMIETDSTKTLDYTIVTTHDYMMLLNKKAAS